jgi:signal transduction histidine kinase
VEVSVEDTGAGLRPEHVQRMFEPFFTTKEDGMGLGLAICQSIIENHGGTLRATNRPEGGLCLRFTLPTVAAGERRNA